jgi:hemoglobin-like flavoprotein
MECVEMTPKQIQLVQGTFEMLVPIADTAVALFYNRMFELDPSLRVLFPTDMARQRQKLIETLATAVRGLETPDEFTAMLRELGRRHVEYGVRPAHYQTMNEALIWMLGQGLGKQFSDEMKEAWLEMYQIVANAMQVNV